MNAHATAPQKRTRSDLERIGPELVAAPPPDKPLSIKEQLDVFAPWLLQMKGNGHTTESIQAELEAREFHFSLRAIGSAIKGAEVVNEASNRKRGRKPRIAAPVTSLPTDV